MNKKEKKIYIIMVILLIFLAIISPVTCIFHENILDKFLNGIISYFDSYNIVQATIVKYEPIGSICDAPLSNEYLILTNIIVLLIFNIITIKYYKEKKLKNYSIVILILFDLLMPIYAYHFDDGWGSGSFGIKSLLLSCDFPSLIDSGNAFRGGIIISTIKWILNI